MPRDGWSLAEGHPGSATDRGERLWFTSAAWSVAEVRVQPADQGAQLTLLWQDGRSGGPTPAAS